MAHWFKRLFPKRQLVANSPFVPAKTNPLDVTPDTPVPFGYKTGWFAISSKDTQSAMDAFEMTDRQQSNWASGVNHVYEAADNWQAATAPVFVTPPIKGWTLVLVGLNYAADSKAKAADLRAFLIRLSLRFGYVQYFGSYRVVDYSAWFRAENGSLSRGFSMADGTFHFNKGAMSQAELDLGFPDLTDVPVDSIWDALEDTMEQDDSFNPFDEELPMRIAGRWSVNPLDTELFEDLVPSLGWVGTIKAV